MTFFRNIGTENGRAKILLYGPIATSEDQCVDSAAVVSELMRIGEQYSNIDIHINSMGGDVFAGMAIYNAIKTCKADINMYVDGMAASIAGVIALCGRPLYMSKYSRLMIHQVSGSGYGSSTDLRVVADMIDSLQKDIAEMLSARLGITAEEVAARYFDGADHWISATEAMGMKIIDGIVDGDDEDMTDGQYSNEEIYTRVYNRLENKAKNEKEMAFIEELKKRAAFANMATEQEMLAHIATLENKAAKADAQERTIIEMKNKLDEQQTAAHTAYLNQAKAEGKITEEQIPTYLNLMKSDEENVKKLIDGMKAKKTITAEEYLNSAGGQDDPMLRMTFNELDKANKLGEFQAKYPQKFEQMYREEFGLNK